jgi:beta-galactosidase
MNLLSRASFLSCLTVVSAFALGPKPVRPDAGARHIEAFDADWHFAKGENPGAEKTDFAEISWQTVSTPHDWSIAGPFDEKAPTRGAGAFLPSGIAWYRKTFSLPADAATKRVFVEFDGVMQNSDVFINGQPLGHRPFGYVSFRYELTGRLNFTPGATNLLAVRTDTSAQPASRWYSGAGIYRHVRLIVTDEVHVDQWATFVTTPTVSADSANVRVQTTLVNQSNGPRNIALRFALIDPNGKIVATHDRAARVLNAGESSALTEEFTLPHPQLWDLATPRLYHATVSVLGTKGTAIDDDTVAFGIRDARFESATGFWLNGRNFKLKGVCLHHDGGAFGAAVPMAVWEERLNALRTLGVNAIRTAHNPPDPAFLDLCDRMGFLVMDELFDCWTVAKNPYDYHLFFNEWSKIDARDTVRRDRNHPSIILYSAGNEIHDTPKEEMAKAILAGLVPVFHENDPTRPVTQALFRPNVSHDYTNGLADLLDVIGTNYRDVELLAAWKDKPGRKIVGTEQQHNRQTWLAARDNAPHSGQFLWSGVDYLGESRAWPITTAGSGLVSRIGEVKPMALERRAWWSESPVVGIVRRTAGGQRAATDPGFTPLTAPQVQFADWTPANNGPHEESVEVYSNCDDVELFLNGQSLGTQKLPADAAPRSWKVAYAPGTLRAVGRNGGKDVATDELRTAGAPAKIVVRADRGSVTSDWNDVVRLVAVVVDASGVPVPNASDAITFAVSGPATLVAVDNANGVSHEMFSAATRAAFNGKCAAWLRANAPAGRITLTATAPGLAPGTATIEAR